MNNEELKEQKSEVRSQKSAVNSTCRQRSVRADGPFFARTHDGMRNNDGKLQYPTGEQPVAVSNAHARYQRSCEQRQSGCEPIAEVVAGSGVC